MVRATGTISVAEGYQVIAALRFHFLAPVLANVTTSQFSQPTPLSVPQLHLHCMRSRVKQHSSNSAMRDTISFSRLDSKHRALTFASPLKHSLAPHDLESTHSGWDLLQFVLKVNTFTIGTFAMIAGRRGCRLGGWDRVLFLSRPICYQ